jgi:hypothetical protein
VKICINGLEDSDHAADECRAEDSFHSVQVENDGKFVEELSIVQSLIGLLLDCGRELFAERSHCVEWTRPKEGSN